MKTHWKLIRAAVPVARRKLLPNLLWLGAGASSVGLLVISCSSVGYTVVAPPAIPGAEFVGMDECATCHEDITRDFKTAAHSRLLVKSESAPILGCEACHGPGSKHVEAGGGAGTIVNMRKNPDGCMNCHLDVKAQFNLPYSHPVLGGKMSCADCHDPHTGAATKGGGTQLARMNETCVQCHTQQAGPWIFEHEAVREGCTSCHSPHGSTNQKMLTERNATLCLKCHIQVQSPGGGLEIGGRNHAGFLGRGTCWTTGCHEGVHGSNTSHHLRN